MWCIPQVDGAYVARMEDVLDLYAEAHDPKRPVVCFDESPTQLIGEVRQPIPAEPGQLERYDCEYKRNGTVNLCLPRRASSLAQGQGDRATHGTRLRRMHARPRRPPLPKSRQDPGVLDNLSTHSAGALYEAFPAPEAHRVLSRIEFHFTPKHASGLTWWRSRSRARPSLDRRIGDRNSSKKKKDTRKRAQPSAPEKTRTRHPNSQRPNTKASHTI